MGFHIYPSTEYNIIKQLKDSGEISMCKKWYFAQTKQHLISFLEEMSTMCSGTKMKKTIQAVIRNVSKSQRLRWYGVVSVPLVKPIYASVMAALMQKIKLRF